MATSAKAAPRSSRSSAQHEDVSLWGDWFALKVLITFAVDDEFAPWGKLRSFERVPGVEVEAYSCIAKGLEILVILTGVGGKKAWANALHSIWNGAADVCVSTGLAGGLRPEHLIGEVCVAKEVESTGQDRPIACDEQLVELAMRSGAKSIGTLVSVDRVVITAESKHELGMTGDAVDMESADVLARAAVLGVRAVAIRAISDSSQEDLPVDFNRVVTGDGDVSIPRVLGELARHPSSLPALVKFGRQSRSAAEKLAVFLDAYVECLATSLAVGIHDDVPAESPAS